MPKIFTHKAVKHSAKQYARKEGDFTVHTNTVESSFSLFKARRDRHVSPSEQKALAALLGGARSPLQPPKDYRWRAYGCSFAASRGKTTNASTPEERNLGWCNLFNKSEKSVSRFPICFRSIGLFHRFDKQAFVVVSALYCSRAPVLFLHCCRFAQWSH